MKNNDYKREMESFQKIYNENVQENNKIVNRLVDIFNDEYKTDREMDANELGAILDKAKGNLDDMDVTIKEIAKYLLNSDLMSEQSVETYILGMALSDYFINNLENMRVNWRNFDNMLFNINATQGFRDGLSKHLRRCMLKLKDFFMEIISEYENELDSKKEEGLYNKLEIHNVTLEDIFYEHNIGYHMFSNVMLQSIFYIFEPQTILEILRKINSISMMKSLLWESDRCLGECVILDLLEECETCIDNNYKWNHSCLAPVLLNHAFGLAQYSNSIGSYSNIQNTKLLKKLANILSKRIDGSFLLANICAHNAFRFLSLPNKEKRSDYEVFIALFFETMAEEYSTNYERESAYEKYFSTHMGLRLYTEEKDNRKLFRKALDHELNEFEYFIVSVYLFSDIHFKPECVVDYYRIFLSSGKFPAPLYERSQIPPDLIYPLSYSYLSLGQIALREWTGDLNKLENVLYEDSFHPFYEICKENLFAYLFHILVGIGLSDYLYESRKSTKEYVKILESISSSIMNIHAISFTISTYEDALDKILMHLIIRVYKRNYGKSLLKVYEIIKMFESEPQITIKMLNSLINNGLEPRELRKNKSFYITANEIIEQVIFKTENHVWSHPKFQLSALNKLKDRLNEMQ